jgi:hypothetical protein
MSLILKNGLRFYGISFSDPLAGKLPPGFNLNHPLPGWHGSAEAGKDDGRDGISIFLPLGCFPKYTWTDSPIRGFSIGSICWHRRAVSTLNSGDKFRWSNQIDHQRDEPKRAEHQ